jgi:hypothetical protein
METDRFGSKPLSNFDLIREVANEMKEKANIVDTTKLQPNMNIESLFKGRGHAILYENPDKSDVGHWTICLRRNDGTCIYFDSYGSKLKNKNLKKILKQKYKTIQYNPHQYQQWGTNPCGRYAYTVLALHKLLPKLNIMDITNFFKKKPRGVSFDKWIIDMTKEVFDDD